MTTAKYSHYLLLTARIPEPQNTKGETTMFVSLKSRLNGSFQIPCLLMVLLLSAHVAFGQAQSNAADLQGTVRDATGAVVANATVTARNPATNVSKNSNSN